VNKRHHLPPPEKKKRPKMRDFTSPLCLTKNYWMNWSIHSIVLVQTLGRITSLVRMFLPQQPHLLVDLSARSPLFIPINNGSKGVKRRVRERRWLTGAPAHLIDKK
jgi:hypothetical protein